MISPEQAEGAGLTADPSRRGGCLVKGAS